VWRVVVLEGVLAGLVVAVSGGTYALLRRRAQNRWRPVRITTDRVIPEPWGIVLASGLPADASTLTSNDQALPPAVNDWLRERGGVDYRESTLRVLVEGLSEETVVIRDITAAVERSLPIDSMLVSSPTAGANPATLLVLELDDDPVRAWEWQDQGGPRVKVGTSPYFAGHNVSLAKNEVHEFLVVASTDRYHCSWSLVLDVQVGARRKTLTIEDKDGPFETSGDPPGDFSERMHWAWYDGGGFKPEPRSGP
jgi:hypothetical protein